MVFFFLNLYTMKFLIEINTNFIIKNLRTDVAKIK